MKQILRTICALSLCASTGAFAQQHSYAARPAGTADHSSGSLTQQSSDQRNTNPADVQSVTCTDKVNYVDRHPQTSQDIYLGGATGWEGAFQEFPAYTGQVTHAYATLRKTGASCPVRIAIFPILSNGEPSTTYSGYVDVTVTSGTYTEYGGTLSSTTNASNGFVVGVFVNSTNANDSAMVAIHDDPDGNDFSYLFYNSTMYSINQQFSAPSDLLMRPKISFTGPTETAAANPTSGCPGTPVNFTLTETGTPGHWLSYPDVYNVVNGPSYSWGFGDAGTSSNQNPSHTYAGSGTFNATATVTWPGWTTSCASSGNVTVSMNGVVPAVTAAATSTVVCTSDNVTFQATPSGGGNSPTYIWKKNGFQVGTGLTYTGSGFVGGDQVECIMTSSDPCANPTTATSNTIVMAAQPGSISAFTYTATGTTVQFTSQSLNAVTHLWDFGDSQTSTAPAPSHTYASTGVYTVQLTTTNSCGVTNLSFLNVNVTTGNSSGGNVGINEQQLAVNGQAFPNPANESVNLVYSMNQTADLTIELMNSLGQVVSVQQVNGTSNGTVQIPMEQLAAGMYFIRLTAGNESTVLHVAHQ